MTEKDELLQAKNIELAHVQQQLQSSEDLVAELQKTLQQRDSELETLRSKVGSFSQRIRDCYPREFFTLPFIL